MPAKSENPASGSHTGQPEMTSLVNTAKKVSRNGLPPLHLWNPPFNGDIDMRIARDGTWFYQGGAIKRFELVRLFSTILRLEDGRYFLVTPHEKVGITVDDAPFVAVDFHQLGDVLHFETNVGDTVTAGPGNAIHVIEDPRTGEPSPYIHVRNGLDALIDRKSFYRLADLAQPYNAGMSVYSAGEYFRIGPAV